MLVDGLTLSMSLPCRPSCPLLPVHSSHAMCITICLSVCPCFFICWYVCGVASVLVIDQRSHFGLDPACFGSLDRSGVWLMVTSRSVNARKKRRTLKGRAVESYLKTFRAFPICIKCGENIAHGSPSSTAWRTSGSRGCRTRVAYKVIGL